MTVSHDGSDGCGPSAGHRAVFVASINNIVVRMLLLSSASYKSLGGAWWAFTLHQIRELDGSHTYRSRTCNGSI